jgi:hypothetical protein
VPLSAPAEHDGLTRQSAPHNPANPAGAQAVTLRGHHVFTPAYEDGAEAFTPFAHYAHGLGIHMGTLHEAAETAKTHFSGDRVMGTLVNGRLLGLPTPPRGQGSSYHLPQEIQSDLLEEYRKHAHGRAERPHPGMTRAARGVLEHLATLQGQGTTPDWDALVPPMLAPAAAAVLKRHRYDGVELPAHAGDAGTHAFLLNTPASVKHTGAQGSVGSVHAKHAEAIEQVLGSLHEGQPYPPQLAAQVGDHIRALQAGLPEDDPKRGALERARERLEAGGTYPGVIAGVEDLHAQAVAHLQDLAKTHRTNAATTLTPSDLGWPGTYDNARLEPDEEHWTEPTITEYEPPAAPGATSPAQPLRERAPRTNGTHRRHRQAMDSAPPQDPTAALPEGIAPDDHARVAAHVQALHAAGAPPHPEHAPHPLLAAEAQQVLAEQMADAAKEGDAAQYEHLETAHARLGNNHQVRRLMEHDPEAGAIGEALQRVRAQRDALQSHLIDHQGQPDPLAGVRGNPREQGGRARQSSTSPRSSSSSSGSSPSAQTPVATRASRQAPTSAQHAQLAAPLTTASVPPPPPQVSAAGNGPARSLLLDDLATPPADLERRGLHVVSPDLHDAVRRAGWRDLEQARAHVRALQHGEETFHANHVVGSDHMAPLAGSHGAGLYLHESPLAAQHALTQGPSPDGAAPLPRDRAGVTHGVPVRVAGRLLDTRGTNGLLPEGLLAPTHHFLTERAARYAQMAAEKDATGQDMDTSYQASRLRVESLKAAKLARELQSGRKPAALSEMARYLGHGATNELLTHLGYTGLKAHDPQTGRTHAVLFSDEHLAPDTQEMRERLEQLTPQQRYALLALSRHDMGGHDYNYFAHTPFGPDLGTGALSPSPLLAGAQRTGVDHTQGPVRDTLDDLTARMAGNTREEVHAIDGRGHVVASSRGDEGTAPLAGDRSGLVMVHSHPVPSQAAQLGRSVGARPLAGFSRHDLQTAFHNGYAATVVVQNGKRYLLAPTPGSGGFTPERWDDHVAPLYDKAHAGLVAEVHRLARKGKTAQAQALLDHLPHHVLATVAGSKKAGLSYRAEELPRTHWAAPA